MPIVTLDTLEGTSGSHDLSRGWEWTQVAIVEDLEPDTTSNLLQAAERAVVQQVGGRGSQCRDLAIPNYLASFNVDLPSATSAKVRIVYRGYPIAVFEFGGGLNQRETNLKLDGSPVVLQYTYPSDYDLDGTPSQRAGKTQKQSGLFPVGMSEPVITVRFTIAAGGGQNSSTLMGQYKTGYEGYVNKSTYTLGGITGQPHEWLIEQVTGTTADGGLSYQAAVTFHLRRKAANFPGGWDTRATFVNPDTGVPPTDLVENTGMMSFPSYPELDFPTITLDSN